MDPQIVHRLIRKGVMPNTARLAESGSFTMMRSTIPPQSPVAWASFITGTDPGTHGIFDFVHRDPATYLPQISFSENTAPSMFFSVGKYRLPLKPGKVLLKRGGKAFWEHLEEHDIGATVVKIPSNFPPSATRQRVLSGMGIPDLAGGYGVFTLYTTEEAEFLRDLTPHNVFYADFDESGRMKEGKIQGPVNDFVRDKETLSVPFSLYCDRDHHTVRIDIQNQTLLLAEKEYSRWVEIEFPLIGQVQTVKGIVKFFLLENGERFRLYISPVQINPRHPALPISTPGKYSRELADRVGLYHTLGLPADFLAIKTEVFSMENFIQQAGSVFRESERLLESELDRFLQSPERFFFFYLSSLDQGQHIYWGLNDPAHPYYHEEESRRFGSTTESYYRRADRIIGETMKKLPRNASLMVVSDHGFAPFYRQVNLNTWLAREGYLHLKKGEPAAGGSIFHSADWGRSRAYGMGLNGLYLNLSQRESQGIVTAPQKQALLRELKTRIEAITDPANGERIVSNAFISEDVFSSPVHPQAPDLIIGFNRGYRSGDSFGEGGISADIVSDNRNWWSGDHCIDPLKVPATFLADFKIGRDVPHIIDLAPTILQYFSIPTPTSMRGRSVI